MPYLHPDHLEQEHLRCREKAVDSFCGTRKMGGAQFSKSYQEQLETEIEELYENFKKHNEGKNIFSSARTPAVLFTVMAVAYVSSGVFGLVGLESFANLMNIVLGLFLVLLCTWVYVRYSGEHRNIGQSIDQIAELIWDNVSNHVCRFHLVYSVFKSTFAREYCYYASRIEIVFESAKKKQKVKKILTLAIHLNHMR